MTKTYPVPPPPPHNEGKTPAAWMMTVGVTLGAAVAAVGMIIGATPVLIGGLVVMAVAIAASVGMSLAGLGKKRTEAAST